MKLIAVLLLGVALLTGCGTEFKADPPREPRSSEAEQLPKPVMVADPTAVSIPAIGAQSTKMTALGLTGATDTCPEGACLDVPPVDEPLTAGWYAGYDPAFDGDEWKPGENGPAIIAGHVDGLHPDGTKGAPGVFAKLSQLKSGDEVVVERAQGQPALTFVVTSINKYPKVALPWSEIMKKTDGPELRLITCGGDFNRTTGHYEDNWVAWAKLKAA